jgi:hypothetical protein
LIEGREFEVTVSFSAAYVMRVEADGTQSWYRQFLFDSAGNAGVSGVTLDGVTRDQEFDDVPLAGAAYADGMVNVVGRMDAGFVTFTLDASTGDWVPAEGRQPSDVAVPDGFDEACESTLPAACRGELELTSVSVTEGFDLLPRSFEPEGGAIVSGTYQLVAYESYEPTCGTADPITMNQTLLVEASSASEGVMQWVSGNTDGSLAYGAAEYQTSGTQLNRTGLCEASDWSVQFTATDSELSMFLPFDASSCSDVVLRYARTP